MSIRKRVVGQEQIFKQHFLDWLDDNEHVYRAFEREAFALIEGGRNHYSSRHIIEHLVRHTDVRETDPTYKIRNDIAPDLARVFRILNPDHADFFEFRSRTLAA